jgi:hypothetical protein
MNKYIQEVSGTWAYNHKHFIITMSLVVVVVWQGLGLGAYLPHSEAVAYEAQCSKWLDCEIEARANEIYENSLPFAREQARLEAMAQINEDMLEMMETSPHIDYKALELKYGSK